MYDRGKRLIRTLQITVLVPRDRVWDYRRAVHFRIQRKQSMGETVRSKA
jgi:hypothetical protein